MSRIDVIGQNGNDGEHYEEINRRQREKRKSRKMEAIAYLGGKCTRCDGIFDHTVYEFHHREPEDKHGCVSNMMLGPLDRLYTELDKCDLVCSNCHRLIHEKDGDYD